MNLLLYGVNVGLAETNDFSIEKEFEQNESKEITADEILETTSEINEASEINLLVTIRNREYTIKLK